MPLYTLSIPKKDIHDPFYIVYKNGTHSAEKTFHIKKNEDVFIDDIKQLIKSKDETGKDLTKIINKKLYIYDPYTEYITLLKAIMDWLKSNPYYVGLHDFRKTLFNKHQYQLFNNLFLPSIHAFLKEKDSVFIRHGMEIPDKKNYDKDVCFPIKNAICWNDGLLWINYESGKTFWSKKKKTINDKCSPCYPIEIDMFPFCSSLDAYKNRKWPSDKQYGFCSNHDALFSWNKLKGYIPYSSFIEKGGKVVSSNKRDHLYAASQIKTYDWLFVFQNVDSPTEKSKYWGWTQKNFNEECYKNDIRKIIENGGKIISQEILFILYKLNW